MIFEVELHMFQKGEIRKVYVPDEELTGEVTHDLGKIYYYGQNDFQQDPVHVSVSAGDIVRYNGARYMLDMNGSRRLNNGGSLTGSPHQKLLQLMGTHNEKGNRNGQ